MTPDKQTGLVVAWLIEDISPGIFLQKVLSKKCSGCHSKTPQTEQESPGWRHWKIWCLVRGRGEQAPLGLFLEDTNPFQEGFTFLT